MLSELRRCNTVGDDRGILYFARAIFSDKGVKRESVRNICSFVNDIKLNFNAATVLFAYFELAEIKGSTIVTTEQGLKIAKLTDDELLYELCKICLNKVLDGGILNMQFIKFDIADSSFYIQRHGFPISAAVFRNFLIKMKALTETADGRLKVKDSFVPLFSSVQKEIRKKLTLQELKEKMERQEEQGALAEAFALSYEQKRNLDHPQNSFIRLISDIDVAAGYDMVSFTDNNATVYDRFIEVKSFSGKPHFYWSSNEYRVAALFGEKYFIYLVNVSRIKEPGYIPQIINNPVQVLKNSDDWIMEADSYLVLPINKEFYL